MNILNKSITPNGSPSMVASQSCTQFRREIKTVASSHSSTESGCRSMQLGAQSKRLNSVLEFGNDDTSKLSNLLPEGQLCNFLPDPIAHVNPVEAFKTVPDDAVFEKNSLGFIWRLKENKQMSIIKDKMASLDIFGSQLAADTLVVSVSSAMKLQRHQLNQIAKKMQKLTGATRVSLKNTIDPSLIAGFVIRYEKEGSHVIDLSVKGELDKLVAQIESKDQRQSSSNESYRFINKSI